MLFKKKLKREKCIEVPESILTIDIGLAKEIKDLCKYCESSEYYTGHEAEAYFKIIGISASDIIRHLEAYLKDEA